MVYLPHGVLNSMRQRLTRMFRYIRHCNALSSFVFSIA
ncbi:hypothetical protein K788_0007561 [Paraburkholderia caribensis MBA4]|uniref:Uncharacterized protein n=1 Tax=Paraburkholderia caribensis MBA4 TaxID=1323664 RepID=A0A0P0RKE8_9BURK|nr:hypothetical protein K788_0007561 [Paraburkholderia caribensis MBA4]CAG9241598.1 conserved hypothetical protein [Paraburkholderia caribensis]